MQLLFIVIFCAFTAIGQTQKLTIEPNHFTIGFGVPIAGGITRVTGKFTECDMLFDYVDEDLTKSRIAFTVKAQSILTGISARDEHLRTADFFDVAQYPEIIFTSTKITGSVNKFEVTGTLQMHGVKQDIVLPVEVTGRLENTIGFQIRSSINRKDFNIAPDYKHTVLPNFFPDLIEVEINLWTKVDKRAIKN